MKGVYILLMKLSRNSKIRVGKLGILDFRRGFYCYIGSGMNSLEKRIERHLKRKKRKHWHIDYFLGKGKIYRVIYAETSSRKECDLAGNLSERFESIKNFGSSDCKCRSHLFFSERKFRRDVFDAFRKSGLKPLVWN